jgi:hypothetical protein
MNELLFTTATDTDNSSAIGPQNRGGYIGNNSILMQYEEMLRDQHLNAVATQVAIRNENPNQPFVAYEVAGHHVTVRTRSLTINDDHQFGGGIEMHKKFECAGVLAALSELHTNSATGKYAVIELGFRQFKSDQALRQAVREPHAAVITASYCGADNAKLAVRPEKGVSLLGWRQGAWVVTKNLPVAPKWSKEAELDMQFFAKQDGMDLILSGLKVYVAPWLHVHDKDSEGKWITLENGDYGFTYSEAKSAAFIKVYTTALGLTPEEGAVKVQENIKVSHARKGDRATYRQVQAVVAENPDVPDMLLGATIGVMVNGERKEMAMRDLIGRKLNTKVGTLNSGQYTVHAGNLAFLAGLHAKGRVLEMVA